MLEHPSLWIGPGTQIAGATRWLIREPASQRQLGLARHRLAAKNRWFRWLAWPTLEVCETDDEALLFTLDRYWGPRATWIVRDADERPVGSLRGGKARDAYGRLLAELEPNANGQRRWLAPDGRELASIQVEADSAVLSFVGDENPFLRMVLLAELLRR